MSAYFNYDPSVIDQDIKKAEFNSAKALGEFEKLSAERKQSVIDGDTPDFFITQGYMFFQRKYSYKGETVKQAYQRIADKLSQYYFSDPELAREKFFNLMWKGFLAPSTPVLNNTGLNRGHSVSCSGGYVGDSIHGFYTALREAAVLSQKGYGTSGYLGDIRARGTPITTGGTASGVVPVFEDFVIMSNKVSQGNNRRGQWAGYIGVMHDDFQELWDYVFKNPTIANIGWLFTNDDIAALNAGEPEIVRRWKNIMYLRSRYGKGYIVKPDTANEMASDAIKNSGIPIKSSNLCVTGSTLLHTGEGLRTAKELFDSQEDFTATVDSRTEIESFVAADGNRDTYHTNKFNSEELVLLEVLSKTTQRNTNKMHLTAEQADVYTIMTSSGYSIAATKYHKFFVYNTETKSIIKKPLSDINTTVDKLLVQSDIGGFGTTGNAAIGAILGAIVSSPCINNGNINNLVSQKDSLNLTKLLSSVTTRNNKLTFGTVASTSDVLETNLSELKFDGIISDFEISKYSKHYQFSMAQDTINDILGGDLTDIGKYLYTASRETITAFIVALFENKGCVLNEYSSYVLTLNNEELIKVVQQLLINFGIKTNRNNKTLTITSYNLAKFRALLEYTHQNDTLDEDELLKSYHSEDTYENIVHIVNTGKKEDVYDTTQSHSHSLIFNGIATGNCTEIFLPQNEEYSFSCVLSSLNLSKWDDFDEDTIYWSTIFLDCVASVTIEQTADNPDIANIHRFTRDFRALGLGTLGWHTLLQSKMLPFDSLKAKILNRQIFKKIKSEAVRASQDLAKLNGEPKFCKGTGMANATLLAIAPNTSSALIVGGVSQGIEPIVANVYNQNTAAGEVVRMNPLLLEYLRENDLYSEELLTDIAVNFQGSIQHIEAIPQSVRNVFKTAYEINQYAIIDQASDRQPHICQGQSLNTFFAHDVTEQEIASVTKYALNNPRIKALYYQRSTRSVRASTGECIACEG